MGVRRVAALASLIVGASLVAAPVALADSGDLMTGGCIGDSDGFGPCTTPTARGITSSSGMAMTPDGKTFYLFNTAKSTITRFTRDTGTGSLARQACTSSISENPLNCQHTARGLTGVAQGVVSSDGRFLYTVAPRDNAIDRFSVNPATGILTLKGCTGDAAANLANCQHTAKGLAGVDNLVVSADGHSLYTTGKNALAEFKLKPSTGVLVPEGCFGKAPANVAGCGTESKQSTRGAFGLSPDGRSLYIAYYDALAQYRRDAQSGKLTFQGCFRNDTAQDPWGPDPHIPNCPTKVPGLYTANSVVVSHNAKHVYVGANIDTDIQTFKRDTGTGKLTPTGCLGVVAQAYCSTAPSGSQWTYVTALVPNSSRTEMYVVSTDLDVAQPMVIHSDGTLAARHCVGLDPDCAGAQHLDDPFAAAIAPGGNSLYTLGNSTLSYLQIAP